jgi:hypothetical protein
MLSSNIHWNYLQPLYLFVCIQILNQSIHVTLMKPANFTLFGEFEMWNSMGYLLPMEVIRCDWSIIHFVCIHSSTNQCLSKFQEDSILQGLVHGHLKPTMKRFSKRSKKMRRVDQGYQISHLEDVYNTKQKERV